LVVVVIYAWQLGLFESNSLDMRLYPDYATSYATEYPENDRTAEEVCPGGSGTPEANRQGRAQVLWCLEIGRAPGGAAAADGGTVYIATGRPGDPLHRYPPVLYAVEATTGVERWRVEFATDVSPSAPVAGNGSVFTCVQGPGRDPATLIAYDQISGVEQWRHAFTDAQHGSSICTAPVAVEDRLDVAKNNQVHALEAKSGLPFWQSEPLELSGRPDLVADDGFVFVNGEREVFAIEAATGTLSWRFDAGVARPYGMIGPLSVDDGRLVIAVDKVAPNLGELIALDARAGSVLWQLESHNPVGLRPVVSGDRVYLEYQYQLVALNAATGNRFGGITSS
jgi:outer membrane protein assembly factor BamB